jgi:Flp pilus assembly protein TadD
MFKRLFLIALILSTSITLLVNCDSEKNHNEEKTEKSPYLNHSLDVKYVGKESCAGCHADIYASFLETGKGRSFHYPSKEKIIEDFSKAYVFDKFSNFHYKAYWKGENMFISEFRLENKDTVHIKTIKIDFVVGSGNQTRSYLYEENGYFYEMPITWYVKKGIWDLSPGYEDGRNARFDRPIGDMCMNCHNSEQQFVENSINRFTSLGQGMSCEKCHGPGEAHVKLMQEGKKVDISKTIDYSIVNPSKLPIQIQFDVCRQCHLEGVTVPRENKHFMNFRPGMKLNDFWDVMVPLGDNVNDFGFASHAERLQQSMCFIKSGEKLTCISCHDPHKKLPENPAVFYNEKCQNCHKPTNCGEKHFSEDVPATNCISCHMPKSGTTDIPHVSTTDHFIRRKLSDTKETPKKDGVQFTNYTSEKNTARMDVLGRIIYFEQFSGPKEELKKVAHLVKNCDLNTQIKYTHLEKMPLAFNLDTLQFNTIKDPNTAYYVGSIFKNTDKSKSLKWIEYAFKLAPENIEIMENLALEYDITHNNTDKAIEMYQLVLSKRPSKQVSLVNLGYLYMLNGEIEKGLELTEKAIKNYPDYTLAYENKTNMLLQLNRKKEALEVLNLLIKENPTNQKYLQLKKMVEGN